MTKPASLIEMEREGDERAAADYEMAVTIVLRRHRHEVNLFIRRRRAERAGEVTRKRMPSSHEYCRFLATKVGRELRGWLPDGGWRRVHDDLEKLLHTLAAESPVPEKTP